MRLAWTGLIALGCLSMVTSARAETPAPMVVEAIRQLYPSYRLNTAPAKPGYPNWGVLEPARPGAKSPDGTPLTDAMLEEEPIWKPWNPTVSPLQKSGAAPTPYYLLLLDHEEPEFGLFRIEGGKPVKLAANSLTSDADDDVHLNFAGAQLDLAPYRIAPNETAFGIRVERELSTTSTGAMETSLDLIRPEISTDGTVELAVIFHANVSETTIDKTVRDKDDNGALQARTSIVTFASSTTKGLYDLILKTGSKTKRYVWNGDKYVPAKRR